MKYVYESDGRPNLKDIKSEVHQHQEIIDLIQIILILWIDFLSRRREAKSNDDDGSSATSDDSSSIVAVALSFVISLLSMMLALYHLWSAGGRQRQRLVDMDNRDSIDRSSLL